MKSDRLRYEYAGVLLGAFLLYGLTCAPGVLWQDSGMFQLRAFQGDYQGDLGLALSHPLYMLCARAAAKIPWGEFAWRVNLVSAVFGAITLANVFFLVRFLTGKRIPAMLTALSLGLGHTFWGHCTIAEVYTLTTAALSAELVCLAMYFRTKQTRWLWGLFLANGLGVANHNLSGLALPVYAALIVYEILKRNIPVRQRGFCGMFWIVGAMPLEILAWQYFRAGHSLGETLHSVLFGNFASAVLGVQIPGVRSILYLLLQFPTPNLLWIIPGIGIFCRRKKQQEASDNTPFLRILLILLGIFLLFAIRYRVPDQYVFFLPAYVLIAILMGMGAWIYARRMGTQAILLGMSLLPIAVYQFVPGWLANTNRALPGLNRPVPDRYELQYFLQPRKQKERSAERFAQAVRDNIPPGALIITDSTTVRPLQYVQLVRGELRRHSVYLQSGDILPDGSRKLGTKIPGQSHAPAEELTSQTLDDVLKQRRVYVVTPQTGYCSPWLLDHYEFRAEWPLYKIAGRKSDFHPAEKTNKPD